MLGQREQEMILFPHVHTLLGWERVSAHWRKCVFELFFWIFHGCSIGTITPSLHKIMEARRGWRCSPGGSQVLEVLADSESVNEYFQGKV